MNNLEFSGSCFWDMDYKELNPEKDRNFIISRVISRGGSNDEIELFKYYGWEVVKEEVLKIRYLNKKILNYFSLLFNIDKKKFKCFNNRSIY